MAANTVAAKLRSLWLDFIVSGVESDYPRALLRRIKFINALSLFGIVTLIVFGSLRLLSGDILLGSVDILLALFLAANLIYLRLTRSLNLSTAIGLTGLLCLILFLFITGGNQGTGIFWLYFFPVTAFFLAGMRLGFLWMALLYGSMFALYVFSWLDLVRLYYPLGIGLQIMASLLLETLMVFYYARVMEREEELIENHNRELQESNLILANEIAQRKQVEDELLRISHAVRSTSDAIAITDLEGRHIFHNKAFLQIFKFTTADINRLGGTSLIYQDRELGQRIYQIIRSGGTWNGEVVMVNKERKLLTMLQRSDAIRDNSGRIIGLISLFTDITAKLESERLQSALFRISEKSSAAKDLDDLYRYIHQVIGELMYAKNMFIALYDASAGVVSFPYFVDEFEQPPPPRPLGHGPTDYVIRTGQPLLASQENIELLGQAGALDLMSSNCLDWLGVPLKKDQETIGVLAVQNYTEAIRYSERERNLLTFVSQHVASAIERRQAQDRIRFSEERFRRVISSISDHIYMTEFSPQGQPTNLYLSPNIEALTGYPYQRFVDDWRFWPEHVIHPEDRQRAAFQVSVFLSGQNSESEYRLIRADGSIIWVRDSARPEVDAETGRITVYGVVSDITQSKYYEEVREKLLQELRRANAELQDFAYIVSHDLKAPLRAISSLAGWLAEDYADKLDPSGREQLQLLLKRTKRMHNLIEGILTYSRLGRLKPTLVRIDSGEAARQVIEALSPPPGISVRLDGSFPEIVYDRTHIEQLFQNLIGNAIKYLGRPQGEVLVSCTDGGDHWVFSVQDNGPGIAPEHFERIFKIFQTLKPRDEVESTGIGLTIVKKIVEQYGGRVWVESQLGQGSTFSFTVPKSLQPDDLEKI